MFKNMAGLNEKKNISKEYKIFTDMWSKYVPLNVLSTIQKNIIQQLWKCVECKGENVKQK